MQRLAGMALGLALGLILALSLGSRVVGGMQTHRAPRPVVYGGF